jgi:hypothetical protein
VMYALVEGLRGPARSALCEKLSHISLANGSRTGPVKVLILGKGSMTDEVGV